MISPPNFSARVTEIAVLPTAVGPKRMTMGSVDLDCKGENVWILVNGLRIFDGKGEALNKTGKGDLPFPRELDAH